MPKSISECVIVITGASSGIGRATALAAAEQKASVILASRQEAALTEVAQECERLGGKALAVRTDVTDENQVMHLAAKAIDKFGRIDAWVNSAAVSLLSGFEDAPADAFRQVLETNFFGCVHGARAALAQFRKQGNGVLINISSVLGKIGSPIASAYSASKFAVAGFSESLRMELQKDPNIHVCAVFPSTVDTPLFQHAANYTGRAVAAPPPVYQPEEVAAVILKCVLKPIREVIVGNVRRTVAMRAMAPGMAEQSYAKKVQTQHFQDRPAPATHGNLFDSMPSYNTVHGGWGNGAHGRRKVVLAAILVLAAGIGAAYYLRESRSSGGLWKSGRLAQRLKKGRQPLMSKMSALGESLARKRGWRRAAEEASSNLEAVKRAGRQFRRRLNGSRHQESRAHRC